MSPMPTLMPMSKKNLPITLVKAVTETDFGNGRMLCGQYIRSLDFDLYFQDVERELNEIHLEYGHPQGALLLAYDRSIDRAVGCIGIRRFDSDSAELKRMYVYPEYRGLQLGRKLLEMALVEASKLGYASVLLDSDSSMKSALRLYREFGFQEIGPYRYNPMRGAVYMKKEL